MHLMESRNFACNMKIPRVEVENAKGNDNDRISNLPNELIQCILCFLSTKDAVRTSFLSKRWEYLWTSIDVLNFEEGHAKRKYFTYFLDRVLILNNSLKLQKFTLSCTVQADERHINSWILAALRRNVKELHLSFKVKGVRDPSVFPHCFFTCASITKLVLSMNRLVGVPRLLRFPSLKILILKNVIFSNDNAAYQLFHGCPVLETLCIHDCNWLKLSTLTISSSSLQSLEIRENNNQNRGNASGCQVLLYCESLKSFCYEGELKNDYCLFSLPSLVDACVSISIPNWDRGQRNIAYRLNKLLLGLRIVTSLTLSTVEVQGYAEELFTHLPVFDKLTRFTLFLGLHELDFGLAKLLIKFPRLEYLTLAEGIFIREENVDGMLHVVSSRVWSNLKSIEVGCFKGSKGEVSAVGMLLKNATVLESLVIYCDKFRFNDMMKRETVREEVLKLPRCKVVLSFRQF